MKELGSNKFGYNMNCVRRAIAVGVLCRRHDGLVYDDLKLQTNAYIGS